MTTIYKDINLNHALGSFLVGIFPIIIFLGSAIINFYIVLIDLILVYEIIRNKNYNYFNNKIFYLLSLIWISLFVNLIFSQDPQNSYGRTFGFLRFIFLVFAIKYYIIDDITKLTKYILNIWTIFFLIICFDLLFEFTLGYNTLGFKSYMPGRLAGFFNQELKIGYLFSFLYLIAASNIYYILQNYPSGNFFKKLFKKYSIYLILLIITLISLFIGERANFIKTLIMVFLFSLFFERKFLLRKILIFFTLIVIIFSIISLLDEKNSYKYRFWGMFLKPIITEPINFVSNSTYGDHYKQAYKIFNDNKLFGVGLKNYRKIVHTGNYGPNAPIHPHEKHLEILSETGLFGYLFFISFFIYTIYFAIKKYLKNNNLYQLSGLLFIFSNLIPFIPSGSFFTTYGAVIFWTSFAFMIFENKNLDFSKSKIE